MSVSVCCTQSGIGKYTVLHRATVFWIQWSYHGKALPFWVANVQECHVFISTVFVMHEITLLYFYSGHEFLQTNLSSGTLIYRSFHVKYQHPWFFFKSKFTVLLKSKAFWYFWRHLNISVDTEFNCFKY